jgi:hypothetical protein
MTRRVLEFTGSDEDRAMFKLLHNGFLIGGNVLQEQALANRQPGRTREERRTSAGIQKKLRGLSSNGASVTVELNPAGGALRLAQDEHEMVMTFLKAVPWSTQEDVAATDLMDRVMAAPDDKE